MEATNGGTLMTVDYESLAASEELQQLVDSAEVTGAIRYPELTELLEILQFDPLEVDAVYRELEARGLEVVETIEEEAAPPPPAPVAVESTTDALQLFLRETGRHPLLTAAQEVELAKRIERG